MSEKLSIQIKKRPWYEWLLWVIWAVFEVFVMQNAIASSSELETRAGGIFWVVFFIGLLAGVVIWYMRRNK